MRPSLLPNLIAAVGRNMARGFADLALFEVGQIYGGDRPEDERLHASGVRRGMNAPAPLGGARGAPSIVFDAKADALAVLSAVGAPVDRLQTVAEGPAWYHPGRVGSLMLGPKNRLAIFGEMHPRVLAAHGCRRARSSPSRSTSTRCRCRRARAPRAPALDASQFQAVTRDFAFVVASDVPADKHRPRRQGRRQGAGRVRLRLRRLHRRGDRRRAEIGGDRGDAAAARPHPDRRGDRQGLRRDRGGGAERHRRRASDLMRRFAHPSRRRGGYVFDFLE